MFATTQFTTLASGIGALALASSSVFAAPVAWTTPSGSNSDISWTNGQSDKGLFGDPTINGSTFLFSPSSFEATASNGSAQSTSDRLAFKLTAAEGKEIQKVTIKEFGDWSIIGGGGVKAFGALYLTKLTSPGFGSVWSDTLDVIYADIENNNTINSPSRPNSEGAGTWDGTFTIDLPAGVTSVQVVLNNILQATSTAGGSAVIQKKGLGGPGNGDAQFVIEAIIPEPTTLSLLFIGGAALLRRQRNTRSTTEN